MDEALRDLEEGRNPKYVVNQAMSLRPCLRNVFTAILGQVDEGDVDIVLQLFQWTILAQSRLRLREWHHILAFFDQILQSP